MELRAFNYRFVVGAELTLPYSEVDQWGDPAPATTEPTVAITRLSDGAVLAAPAVTAPDSSDDDQSYTAPVVAASDNVEPDIYTVEWTSGDSGAKRTELIQTVGGPFFRLVDVADAGHRIAGDPLAPRQRWARSNAEAECEAITGRSFVPALRDEIVRVDSATAEIMLDAYPLRELVAVTELALSSGATDTAWTAAELAAIVPNEDGIVRRVGDTFSAGTYRFVYRHGHLTPPGDIVEAVMKRHVHYLTKPRSGVDSRALGYTSEDGTNYRLSIPNRERTGDTEVDAIYGRYRHGEYV